jgi:hypothetical protein
MEQSVDVCGGRSQLVQLGSADRRRQPHPLGQAKRKTAAPEAGGWNAYPTTLTRSDRGLERTPGAVAVTTSVCDPGKSLWRLMICTV